MLELICNMTTAVLQNDEWDPTKLFGQNQHLFRPQKLLDNSTPFGKGRELIIDNDVDPRGMNNIYIDNLILLTFNIENTDNLNRCNQAPLLMFNTCYCPLDPNEAIPRETMEARNKL
jgi:hypothetical protein